jgi:hypothetical protein
MNDFDQMAQSQSTPAAAPAASAVAPATSNTGNDFEQMAQQAVASTPTTTTGTNAPTTPSYLSQVEEHIANTAHAIWHGLSETEASPWALAHGAAPTATAETDAEKGSTPPPVPPKSMAQHAMDTIHTALSDVGIPNTAEQVTAANKLLGEQMRHPFRTAEEVGGATITGALSPNDTEALQKAKDEYKNGNYVESARHFINYLVPFVGGSADKAGDAVDSKEWGKAMGHIVPAVLPFIFGGGEAAPITSPEEAAANAARQFKETPAQTGTSEGAAAKNVGVKTAPVAPVAPPTSVPRNPEIGPQERTVAGPQTTLRPTTQTTAGVTAPITALQQENVSPLARVGAKLASPGSDAEFQKTQTQPAAQRQLISTVGQPAEDKIAKLEAIREGKPAPNPIAGTQIPSKFQTFDDAAKATETSAMKTYQKADLVSDRDIAAWQTATRDALNEHKAAIDKYNSMVDEYNANRNTADDKEMPRATYDPNAVSIPEKPKSYSELKAELDRAKAEGASSDAAVREEAYKTGIPKAEKAIEQWFKQHSDDISPAEYSSAKALYADSQRFQEIANGLRSATNKGTLTGNTLRGLESTIDNKMIRRGQAPGAFQRLLGEDAYDNWTNVAKLFDPVKGALQGQKSWGTYATEYIVASVLGIKGIAAKAATEMLMNRIMFHPEWGQWFSKFTNTLKNLATREHGELGAPGTVGEPFDQNDRQHFFDLMNEAQGKAAGEVKAQAPVSLLDQVHEEQNPNYVYRARGVGEQGVPLTNEHAQATSDLAQAQKYAEAGQRSPEQGEVVRVDLNKLNHEDYNIKQHPDGMQWAQFTRPLGEHEVEQVPPATPTMETAVLPEAKPATAVTDEYKQSLGQHEIATTRPSAVGADNANNPDRTSGIKTLAEATPKMRETIAQSIANYKDSGLKLTPDELEDPASYQASIIKKAVAHYKDNLVALYNAIPESIRGISKQWYESAHDLSKKFSEQYGVSHPQAAAVIAALSPNNPWDNNVGMAQRLMKTWEEDTGRIWDEKMDEKLSSIRNAKSTKPEFRAYLDSIRGKSYNDLQGETEAETAAMKGLWLRMVDQSYGSPEIPVYAPDGTIRGSQKIAWGPYDAVAKAVKILDDGDIETINHLMGNGHKIRNFYNNIINPWSDRGHVTIDTHAVGAAHWKPFSQKDTEVAHNFGGSTPGIPGAGKHAGTGLAGTYPIYDEAYKQAAKEVGVSPRELQSITWEGIRSLFSGAKKTPELRKAVSEIWAKVGEGKMTPEAARQAIIERSGGFKRPVWTTDNQWNGTQETPQNPSVAKGLNQTISLGEGANSIKADVNSAELNPELKGQPRPTIVRNVSGHIPKAQIENLAKWMDANVSPRDMLISAAHEIAHEFTQHYHGLPTADTGVTLGHSALEGAVAGGYFDTGRGWNDRLKVARATGGDARSKFLDDYTSHTMAGRAIEEMLGEPPSVVKEHASGDTSAAKHVLKASGMHPYIMDNYLTAATERAKEILRDNWDTVHHMTAQAVQHFGKGKIDADTLQKYRQGGTYK